MRGSPLPRRAIGQRMKLIGDFSPAIVLVDACQLFHGSSSSFINGAPLTWQAKHVPARSAAERRSASCEEPRKRQVKPLSPGVRSSL